MSCAAHRAALTSSEANTIDLTADDTGKPGSPCGRPVLRDASVRRADGPPLQDRMINLAGCNDSAIKRRNRRVVREIAGIVPLIGAAFLTLMV